MHVHNPAVYCGYFHWREPENDGFRCFIFPFDLDSFHADVTLGGCRLLDDYFEKSQFARSWTDHFLAEGYGKLC